jgi:hypothetical protein
LIVNRQSMDRLVARIQGNRKPRYWIPDRYAAAGRSSTTSGVCSPQDDIRSVPSLSFCPESRQRLSSFRGERSARPMSPPPTRCHPDVSEARPMSRPPTRCHPEVSEAKPRDPGSWPPSIATVTLARPDARRAKGPGSWIPRASLPGKRGPSNPKPLRQVVQEAAQTATKATSLDAPAQCKNYVTEAAARLRISRFTCYRMMRPCGLEFSREVTEK